MSGYSCSLSSDRQSSNNNAHSYSVVSWRGVLNSEQSVNGLGRRSAAVLAAGGHTSYALPGSHLWCYQLTNDWLPYDFEVFTIQLALNPFATAACHTPILA